MRSEARLLMHKPAGQTDFVIRNIVCDAKVFQQYNRDLAFIDDYNSPERLQDILLSSISVIPQNIDKLFETKPATRPELPPGVRRLELDDAPDEVKPVPTWTVEDYTRYIKQTQIRIDERSQGYTLLNSPLFMFTPNTGPVALIDSGGSTLQQALLLDLHNGFNLTVPSRKIKRQGQFWVFLNNTYLKETDIDLLVILNFEVEPFEMPLSQQLWPSYPQTPPITTGTWIRYDNNTGNTTAQPVSVNPNPPRYSFNGGNYVIASPGGTTRTYLNGVELAPSPTPQAEVPVTHITGPAIFPMVGDGTLPVQFYVNDVLQEGGTYTVPAGREFHVERVTVSLNNYVVRGTLV